MLDGRECGSARSLLAPESLQYRLDAPAQMLSRRFGLGPVLGKNGVQNDDVRAELHEPLAHRIELAFGRADKETKDERGARRDHAHGELDHVLGLLAQVMSREYQVQPKANQRSAADARGAEKPDRERRHRLSRR